MTTDSYLDKLGRPRSFSLNTELITSIACAYRRLKLDWKFANKTIPDYLFSTLMVALAPSILSPDNPIVKQRFASPPELQQSAFASPANIPLFRDGTVPDTRWLLLQVGYWKVSSETDLLSDILFARLDTSGRDTPTLLDLGSGLASFRYCGAHGASRLDVANLSIQANHQQASYRRMT